MKETLLRLKKDWELILFTASAPEYANRIVNAIDPDGSIFNFRLYRKSLRVPAFERNSDNPIQRMFIGCRIIIPEWLFGLYQRWAWFQKDK